MLLVIIVLLNHLFRCCRIQSIETDLFCFFILAMVMIGNAAGNKSGSCGQSTADLYHPR